MPSPIGHALGGIAAGWNLAPRRDRTAMWTLAAAGVAADLDLLFHAHRGPSHSIGAAVIVGVLVWCVTTVWSGSAAAPRCRASLRWGMAASAGWLSHVLLDWFGEDTWPPIGIQALWPFSNGYYQSLVVIFPSVSRQYWLGWRFVYFNVKALAVELVVLLPIAWLIVKLSTYRSPGRSSARDGRPRPSAGAAGTGGTSDLQDRREVR
jgi:membrane-bound metal-dependent hydrolase YbcI (DUF457 family)